MDDAISVSSGSREASPELDRRGILDPVITNVVSALGGLETISETETAYILGDSCLGCLKDLKKIWRKDDTDDERTVARIFYEKRVLQRDLVPILLETAGKGKVEDKCALACADLITAMTWPIDVAEELKELDDELDAKTDYTSLIQAQRSYKAAMLRPGAIAALFSIMLPPLAKGKGERTERDGQIINLILHCFRNLAFIKDPPPNAYASGEQAEYATLQSKLITTLSGTNVLDAFLTFASNAGDPLFNPWNNLLLEIFYLLFRGVKPNSLVSDQKAKAKEDLRNLLETETKSQREDRKHKATRHSRFGTTITVKAGQERFIMHRQAALTAETSEMMDLAKKKRAKGVKKQDDLGGFSFLSTTARTCLQGVAKEFIRNCFNRFLSSLLKDIRMERPKITEKDHVRLLFVTTWFAEFFIAARSAEGDSNWGFVLIKEVVEEEWVKWVLRRMREAGDEKPKQWVELQAGINCLTQLLLLIELMSASESIFSEAAVTLQHKLFYNAEILEMAFENLRGFREQTAQKSIAYLDSSVQLSYVLLRILEKWAKNKGNVMVVRKKKKTKKKKAGAVTEEEGIVDVASEEEDAEEAAEEQFGDSMITFDVYEHKFAHPEVNATLLTYLNRYEEFESPDQMKQVVGLLHRQAIKVKAENLFFRVSTLELFHRIIKDEKTFPKEQAYKDLLQLVKYILRQFFKLVAEDSFVLVESFFPKRASRASNAKKAAGVDDSSDEDVVLGNKGQDDSKHGPDIKVKKGYTWSQQLGIAVGCLIEQGKMEHLDWVKEILIFVIGHRQRIISDTDDFLSNDLPPPDDPEYAEKVKEARMRGPSVAALSKIEDYIIPYVTQEKADAATKDKYLKLVFTLVKFFVSDESADELEWYVPAAILPDDLQRSLEVIDQFIATPLDLGGKKASDMISKPRKPARAARRTRRRRGGDDDGSGVVQDGRLPTDDSGASDSEGGGRRKAKRKKKEKEKVQYKSAQFIEDSDAALTDDETFFAREKALREKAAAAGVDADNAQPVTSNMAATGTKKRKKKKGADGPAKKFKSWTTAATQEDGAESSAEPSATVQSDADDGEPGEPVPKPRPRPRPRPKKKSVPEEPPKEKISEPTEDDDEVPAGARMRFGGGMAMDDPTMETSSPGWATSPAPTRSSPSGSGPKSDEEEEPASGARLPRRRFVVTSDEDD